MKIISLQNPDIQQVFDIKKNEGYCQHNSIIFDEKMRSLECKDCNAVIEPFDFIKHIAYKEHRYFITLRDIQSQIKVLRNERNDLYRQVTNLKSQIRRAVRTINK